MIPGASQLLPKGAEAEANGQFKKMMVIMDSMNSKGKYTKKLELNIIIVTYIK